MHFSRDNEWYQVSRITGPTHNKLGLKFGPSGGSRPPIEALLIGNGEAKIVADEVQQQVLEGVAEANAEFGTDYQIAAILYVVNDTPSPSVYRMLARYLIKHLTQQGAFTNA
jgi:hypothetical protein